MKRKVIEIALRLPEDSWEDFRIVPYEDRTTKGGRLYWISNLRLENIQITILLQFYALQFHYILYNTNQWQLHHASENKIVKIKIDSAMKIGLCLGNSRSIKIVCCEIYH